MSRTLDKVALPIARTLIEAPGERLWAAHAAYGRVLTFHFTLLQARGTVAVTRTLTAAGLSVQSYASGTELLAHLSRDGAPEGSG